MATAREREIQIMEAQNSLYGGGPGSTFMKKQELANIQRTAAAERQRISQESRSSAQQRAQAMMTAAGYQSAAAAKMAEQQRANLAESQARTEAATKQSQEYMNPWREAGLDALGKIQEKIEAGPGDFKESPGYQFRLAEGQKAIERSAAARGGALSGAAIKAGMRYGQEFATNDYDNFLRRYYDSYAPLQQLSGQGMSASQTMGTIGMQGARDMASQGFAGTTAIGEATRYGADAQAGGTMRSADIIDAQRQAAAERDYGYAAWKAGEDF